ncbi:winged helix DNA-binding protein [Halomicrobium mukohataei]|uniref:Winged helix DNA-binding protein n=1 Tax=Halomicrobium mukohataei TaxID=57705 RepID=A0A847UGR3_9EURY|nr:metal-dependent transcriptional regulator [Halomicrobium mukohataei]NLV11676.1 winged helix DNA-binding protein [Halomicrobium mukohataei]
MASESQMDPSSFGPSETERNGARYLFAISVLAESRTDRVATGELRKYMGVTAASVTEMVTKLDGRGLVEHEKYQGVALTERGEQVATQAGWRLCVVATFFDSVLDVTLDEETAFDIGFVLPETGLFRLRALADSACLGLCPDSDGDAQCVA